MAFSTVRGIVEKVLKKYRLTGNLVESGLLGPVKLAVCERPSKDRH